VVATTLVGNGACRDSTAQESAHCYASDPVRTINECELECANLLACTGFRSDETARQTSGMCILYTSQDDVCPEGLVFDQGVGVSVDPPSTVAESLSWMQVEARHYKMWSLFAYRRWPVRAQSCSFQRKRYHV
jgi:hypothetical protein